MKTKIAAALAALMLIGTMTVPAFAAPSESRFVDVSPDAWYFDAVTRFADLGVVNGVGEGRFNPNGDITWAEFATILHRLALGDEESCALEPGETRSWGNKAMAYASKMTMQACPRPVRGVDTIEYDAVTRAEAANYLTSYFVAQTNNYTIPYTWERDAEGNAFSRPATIINNLSPADIPDWDKVLACCGTHEVKGVYKIITENRILFAIQAGIINGVDTNHTFDPNGHLTRAQFCQMLWNAGVRDNLWHSYYSGFNIAT